MFSQESVKNSLHFDFILGVPIYFSPVGITKITDNNGFNNVHLAIGNTYFFNSEWGIDVLYSLNRFFCNENISNDVFGKTENFPLYNGEYSTTIPNNTFNTFTLGPVYRKQLSNKFSLQTNLNMGLFSFMSENYSASAKVRGSNNLLYKEFIVPHTYSFMLQPSLQLNYKIKKVELFAKLYYIHAFSQIETTTIEYDFLEFLHEEYTQKNTFNTLMFTVGVSLISRK